MLGWSVSEGLVLSRTALLEMLVSALGATQVLTARPWQLWTMVPVMLMWQECKVVRMLSSGGVQGM